MSSDALAVTGLREERKRTAVKVDDKFIALKSGETRCPDRIREIAREVEVSTEKANVKAREFYKACGFSEDAVLLEQQLEASIGE